MVVGDAPVVQFHIGIDRHRLMLQGRVKVLTSVDVLHRMGRRLAVGLFNTDKGLLTGHGFGQLGLQFIGVMAYGLFAAITAWIAWSVLGALSGGIRVSEQEETEGLDIGEHGMEAYPDFVSTTS